MSSYDLRERFIDVAAEAGGDPAAVTTAIANAAIIAAGSDGRLLWRRGTYIVPGLQVAGLHGQVWEGESERSTILQTGSGDLITFSGASTIQAPTFERMTLQSIPGGGHLLVNNSGLVRATWRHVTADQQNDAKSIFLNGDKAYIGCLWQSFNALMPATSSVPGFQFVTSTTRVNGNTWQRGTIQGGGTHFFLIECDHAATYNYDNAFRDLIAEITNAGIARILTGFNTIFDNVNAYDLSTTTQNLFVVDKGAGGLTSKNTTFRRMGRRTGSLGGGLSDITIVSGGAQGVTIENAQNATLTGYTIDLGNVLEAILLGIPAGVTVNNMHSSTVRVGRSGGTVQTGHGITASRPANPGLRDQWFDDTLGKPIWFDGTNWRDAAGTVV